MENPVQRHVCPYLLRPRPNRHDGHLFYHHVCDYVSDRGAALRESEAVRCRGFAVDFRSCDEFHHVLADLPYPEYHDGSCPDAVAHASGLRDYCGAAVYFYMDLPSDVRPARHGPGLRQAQRPEPAV